MFPKFWAFLAFLADGIEPWLYVNIHFISKGLGWILPSSSQSVSRDALTSQRLHVTWKPFVVVSGMSPNAYPTQVC